MSPPFDAGVPVNRVLLTLLLFPLMLPLAAAESPDAVPAGGADLVTAPNLTSVTETPEGMEAVSYGQAVSEALQNNPTLQAARHTLQAALEGLGLADSAFWPQVSLDASLNRDFTGQTVSGTVQTAWGSQSQSGPTDFGFGVGATWNLFDGFATLYGRQAGLAQAEVQRAAYRQASAQVRLNLKQSFNQVLYDELNLSLLAQIEQLLNQETRYLDLEYASGQQPRWTYLQAQSSEAQTKWQLEQQQLGILSDRENLAALMGRPDGAGDTIEAVGDLELSPPPSNPDLAALAQSPALLQAQASTRQLQAEYGASLSSRYPSLDASAGYQFSGDTALPPSTSKANLGLTLSYDLFTGGGDEAKIGQAWQGWQASLENQRNTLNTLKVALKQAWLSDRGDFDRLPIEDLAVEVGVERFNTVNRLFEAGQAQYPGFRAGRDQLDPVRGDTAFGPARIGPGPGPISRRLGAGPGRRKRRRREVGAIHRRLTMRKSLTLLAVLLLAAAGCGKNGKQGAQQKVQVTRGDLQVTVQDTGSVQPLDEVQIIPPVAGRVDQILVDEGTVVKKGQVLAWMSSSDRAALLDMARAKGAQELAYWEGVYKSTPIVAPVSGLIINRNVVEGQTVSQSTDIYDMSDQLIVVANVDETDLGKISMGQEAQVTVDAYPDQPFACKVMMITHEAVKVNNVVCYNVKLKAQKAPADLRAGMTANVNFIVSQSKDVLLLPSWAVKGAENSTVPLMVANDPKQKPQKTRVELGDTDGNSVQVVSGLNEGTGCWWAA